MNSGNDAESADDAIVGNTFGWDTVYGIRFDDVNNAITKDYNGPPNYTRAGDGSLVLTGDLNPWQMSGGSGHLLIMAVSGPSFDLEGFPQVPPATITRQNPVYLVEVELELIPRVLSESADPADGTPVDLMLKLPSDAPGLAPEMVTQINVVDVDWDGFDQEVADYDPMTDPFDPTLVNETIRLMMTDWFNEPGRLAQFNQVFATVNLNSRIADADAAEEEQHFDWISPSAVAYGVGSAENSAGTSDNVLALMCMGKGRADKAAELGHTVSPAIVPGLARSGFLISKERFLENMLLPGMGQVFANGDDKDDPDWPAANFVLSGNGTRIENTGDLFIKELNIAPDDKDEELVEARIPAGGVQLTISDVDLELRMQNLVHPYNKGFGGFLMDATHQITIKLHADINDEKKFLLVPGPDDAPEGSDILIHNVSLTKSDHGEVVDWVLFTLDVVGILLTAYTAVKGVKAARAASKATSAAADAAEAGIKASATLKTTGEGIEHAKQMQAAAKLVQAATAAGETATRLAPKVIIWQKWATIFGSLTFALTGLMVTKAIMENMVEEGDIKDNSIPDVGDFAARVMKPVQWPNATGFEVTDVSFNGGLHILGNPVFAD